MNKNIKNVGEVPLGTVTFEELAADLKSYINNEFSPTKKVKESPGFPLEVLPPQIREFIITAERALGTPVDFMAAAVLFTASVAIGNTHLIELKRGSLQSGLLFLILIGNPNSNKTRALQVPLQPVFDRDAESYKLYRKHLMEYDTKQDNKETGTAENKGRPIWRKTIIQDATPEAVASIHLNNLRGVAIYRDEIAGWFKGFNRYHSGGEQEFWLSIWSGAPISIDRKTSDPIYIRRPFIPISGTIQPAILGELAKDNRQSNGFIDRLLFVWPDGLEKSLWTDDEMPYPLKQKYYTGINRLLDLTFTEENKPYILSLS